MTDAYDVYQEVLSQVNKEENGYLPADLFNIYSRAANRDVFNEYGARLQSEQIAAAEKLRIHDRLAPFERHVTATAKTGIFPVPPDYAYFQACKIKNDGGAAVAQIAALNKQLCEAEIDPTINVEDIQRQLDELAANAGLIAVELKDHDQVSRRMNSFVPGKRPSLKKPIMERITTLDSAGKTVRSFQVWPAQDLTVFLTYYRRPMLPHLVMSPDQYTGELVYNAAASTGFDWEEEGITDIVNRIVTDFATYIREGGLLQMAQAKTRV